jgi:hypothetical protein
MTNLLSYNYVKECFEKRGDNLLSEKYKDNRTHLDYICGKCDEKCSITYNNYQKGHGCPHCARNKKLTLEFVKETFKKRGDILLSKHYINARTKLQYKCGNCDEKCSIIFDSYRRGHGCGNCAGNKKLTLDFVKETFEKRGDILLSKDYINTKTILEYICGKCGDNCSITYSHYKQGNGCPHCCKSRPEKLTREIFERIMGSDFSSVRPDFLKNPETGRNLELDGYNENLKLAFEYNGKQHYQFTKHFHETEDNFKKQRERDEFKYKRCIEMGITLISVPYTFNCYNPGELEIFIKDQLFQNEFIFFL